MIAAGVCVAASLLSVGSSDVLAAFTDQESYDGVSAQSEFGGTFDIMLEAGAERELGMTVKDMAPGTTHYRYVDVVHAVDDAPMGALSLSGTVISGGDMAGPNGLSMSVRGCPESWDTSTNSCPAINGWHNFGVRSSLRENIGSPMPIPLDIWREGATVHLQIEWMMNPSAENDMQGKSSDFDLKFTGIRK